MQVVTKDQMAEIMALENEDIMDICKDEIQRAIENGRVMDAWIESFSSDKGEMIAVVTVQAEDDCGEWTTGIDVPLEKFLSE